MAKRADESIPVVSDLPMEAADRAAGLGSGWIEGPRSIGPIAHDWRAIDPSTIQGEGIPVEELRFYRETIGEMLRSAAGAYVLIVGRERISYFPDLEVAARHAEKHFRGRTFLIKKVAPIEPIHTTGGVVG
jgi:hypothetical protein